MICDFILFDMHVFYYSPYKQNKNIAKNNDVYLMSFMHNTGNLTYHIGVIKLRQLTKMFKM